MTAIDCNKLLEEVIDAAAATYLAAKDLAEKAKQLDEQCKCDCKPKQGDDDPIPEPAPYPHSYVIGTDLND